MTKLQKSKKGFTLTELAIVIAVIAILIAVLVPTFTSLINKAQESSDSQLVKNLNTALSTEEAIDGKAETMAEALAVASENGYNVDRLTPASTGDIVWDQESNRFLLIDEKGSIVYSDSTTSSDVLNNKYQLWYIVESADDLDKTGYSQYLAYEVSGEVVSENGASIDVGSNTNVTLSVSGTAATSTSSSTSAATPALASKKLTAESASSGLEFRVNSNGSKVILEVTGEVTIYGTVSGNIELKSGKLTIAESAYVPAVYVTASTEKASEVSITNNSSNTIEVASENIAVATLTGSDSTLNAVEVTSADLSYFAGGFGTKNSPYLISSATQFANISKYSDAMMAGTAYYFALNADIDLRTLTIGDTQSAISEYFCGTLDGDDHVLIANDNLAYIIANAVGNTTFTNINYQLISKNIYLCGGQKVKTDNGGDYSANMSLTLDDIDITTVDDTVIKLYGDNEGLLYGWVGASAGEETWISSTYASAYTNLVTIKNCDIDVDISGSSYNGVFIGGGVYRSSAVVSDCTYSGTFTGEFVNLVLGNSYENDNYKPHSLIITNVTNSGTLYGTGIVSGTTTVRSPMFAAGNGSTEATWATIDSSCSLGNKVYTLSDDGLALSKDTTDNSLIVSEASAKTTSYYVLTFTGGSRYTSAVSVNSSYRFSILLSASFTNSIYDTGYTDGQLVTLAQYKTINTDWQNDLSGKTAIEVYGENGATFYVTTYSGTVYYVFEFANSYCYFGSDRTSKAVDINKASITAYDSDGVPIAQKNLSLKDN